MKIIDNKSTLPISLQVGDIFLTHTSPCYYLVISDCNNMYSILNLTTLCIDGDSYKRLQDLSDAMVGKIVSVSKSHNATLLLDDIDDSSIDTPEEINWETIPPNTKVLVKDHEDSTWCPPVYFVAYHPNEKYPFETKNALQTKYSSYWKYCTLP